MVKRRLPRPRDPVQRAHLIMQIATGEVVDECGDDIDERARELGKKGGAARAKKLSAKRRSEIARKAAETRWRK